MRRHPLLLSACFVLGLAGCTVGPDYVPNTPNLPAGWSGAKPKPGQVSNVTTQAAIDDAWWKVFNDPALDALIERAGTSNLDIQNTGLRIAAARAQLNVAGARDYPKLALDSSYTRSLISPNGALALFGGGGGTESNGETPANAGAFPAFGGLPPFGIFQSGFDASWELDLFGRVRRQKESAEAQTVVAVEDRNAALLSVYAEITRSYFTLRGVQRLIAITQENLNSQQQSFKLTRDQASGGATSNLDVESASAQVETTAAQMPLLEDQRTRAINALSRLLGREPGALEQELGVAKPIPAIPLTIPIGMPGDLVRRRPDIRGAEAQFHAATADIGVATADLFPRLTLAGGIGLQALKFDKLADWNSKFYNVGPNLQIPIFNGTTYANISLQKVRQQQAALVYQNTVLGALHDVENAVSSFGAEQVRLQSLMRAARANRHALDLAQQRYKAGVSNFLEVLDAERRVFASDNAVVNSTITIANNLIAIYKALGGGWEMTKLQPDKAAAG